MRPEEYEGEMIEPVESLEEENERLKTQLIAVTRRGASLGASAERLRAERDEWVRAVGEIREEARQRARKNMPWWNEHSHGLLWFHDEILRRMEVEP